MRLLNGIMMVTFLTEHNHKIGVGMNGLPIIRAEKWLNTEAEEADAPSRFDENENYLETNPQICVVRHESAQHDYKPGDKLFLHYMAWEWTELTEYGHVVDTDHIMFKINEDDTFELIDDLYLGEAIYSDEEVTTSGIILLEGKKDNLRIRITHLPPNNTSLNIGDIVISIDKNNYEFDYWSKKYIKIMSDEIVGVITDNKLKPLALSRYAMEHED
jgi:hypothetical protein